MPRWSFSVLASLILAGSAVAAPAPRKDAPAPGDVPTRKAPATPAKSKETPKEPTQFEMTEETEVLLDGQPCEYADVPDNAIVVRMEVLPDRRTIVRMHFRSRR